MRVFAVVTVDDEAMAKAPLAAILAVYEAIQTWDLQRRKAREAKPASPEPWSGETSARLAGEFDAMNFEARRLCDLFHGRVEAVFDDVPQTDYFEFQHKLAIDRGGL